MEVIGGLLFAAGVILFVVLGKEHNILPWLWVFIQFTGFIILMIGGLGEEVEIREDD